MSDYFYNQQERELFIHKNLQPYKLNETANFIFQLYIENYSIESIVNKLLQEYDLDAQQAALDVGEITDEFKRLEIFPRKETKAVTSGESDFLLVRTNLQLHTPIVHIIQNCNSPCKMCDCWKTKTKQWHPADALRLFFSKVKQLGAVAIMVSGGEPLLHPELPQIIKDLKELNLQVMLNTNALLLHKNLWLTDLQIEQLVVSMDGYNPETYKTYRGLDGYHTVWSNLEHFQKRSPQTKIGVRTILNKFNYDKIDLLIKEIELRGMHSVGLSPADIDSESFSRKGINQQRTQQMTELLLPTETQINDFLEYFTPNHPYYQKIEEAASKELSSWTASDFIRCMLFYLGIHKGNKEMFSNRPCYFPYISLVLDYNGDLRNCFYSKAFGNLYDFQSIDWSFQNAMLDLQMTKKCQGCRGKIFCGA